MRPDELEVPVRIGDRWPWLPVHKPLDLTSWQLITALASLALALYLDGLVQLSDESPDEGLPSPMLLARLTVLALGASLVFYRPGGRLWPLWPWLALKHDIGTLCAYHEGADPRGARYFLAEVEERTRMRLDGEGAIFVVDPPHWWLVRHTPLAEAYWRRHVPYRALVLPEPQGSLELMTDIERAARWHALTAGLKGLSFPVQFTIQTRPEDAAWMAEHAQPPIGAPAESLRGEIGEWASKRARGLIARRLVVACSAPERGLLVEHVRDVVGMLADAGLSVRQPSVAQQRQVFDDAYGQRDFYPRSRSHFGIGSTDWVSIEVREFPRSCVVGWVNLIVRELIADVGLFAEPDDGAWVTRSKEWFEGFSLIRTSDKIHHLAADDLAIVESTLKHNADSLYRTSLVVSVPREHAARVSNRLRKAGALGGELTFEHEGGRLSTVPRGGRALAGATYPLPGSAVAGCFPFGSGGLRMDRGAVLGVDRHSPEVFSLDLCDPALRASMVVVVGATGAGKTVLLDLLLGRSGLPFSVIDMKPHLDERRHGDFYPLIKACRGSYHVCQPGKLVPDALHPTAQCYNLAGLEEEERPAALLSIARLEWRRAIDSLEDRIFAIDEAYELGRTEGGQAFIERVVSLGRSVGFVGVVATQEVTDFLGNARMAKAVTQSSMQFVLAQESSNVDPVADKMKLGGDAREELRTFQPAPGDEEAAHRRYAIVRVGQRMCSIRIEASPAEMALYTTRPADKRARRIAA